MRLDYEVLCYRVMFKTYYEESWHFSDYSTEERAIIALKECIDDGYCYAKLLYIQKACFEYDELR